ncbi:MAG: hypothetical protein J3R72DRAFT_419386 [Linnemannia gamsii]|nr:MAG: hypothetical protein J3R72DRAFT_419386 [Linnemannia gamsii]
MGPGASEGLRCVVVVAVAYAAQGCDIAVVYAHAKGMTQYAVVAAAAACTVHAVGSYAVGCCQLAGGPVEKTQKKKRRVGAWENDRIESADVPVDGPEYEVAVAVDSVAFAAVVVGESGGQRKK